MKMIKIRALVSTGMLTLGLALGAASCGAHNHRPCFGGDPAGTQNSCHGPRHHHDVNMA